MRQRGGAIYGDGTVAAFERHGQILRVPACAGFGLIVAVPENGGEEFGIENGAQETMVADRKAPAPDDVAHALLRAAFTLV